jgi:hypothetical protein
MPGKILAATVTMVAKTRLAAAQSTIFRSPNEKSCISHMQVLACESAQDVIRSVFERTAVALENRVNLFVDSDDRHRCWPLM